MAIGNSDCDRDSDGGGYQRSSVGFAAGGALDFDIQQKKGGAEAPPFVEVDRSYCGRIVVGSLLPLSSTDP